MSGDDSSSSASDDSTNKRRKLSDGQEEGGVRVSRTKSSPTQDDGDGIDRSPDGGNRVDGTSKPGKRNSLMSWDRSGRNQGNEGGRRERDFEGTGAGTTLSGKIKAEQDKKSKPTAAASTSTNARSEREERRMEANRQRARDIRKRKKKMVEEMKQQIVQLTIENRQLHRQNQLQQTEIQLLRRGQPSQGMMGRQQQPAPPHLLNPSMMGGSPFLGGHLQDSSSAPSSASTRNNSMLTNPAALSGVLHQQNHPLGSSMPLLNPSRQHFLSDNPTNTSMGGMSMMGLHGANMSNPQSSVGGGMQGLPPSHIESGGGGSGMFTSNREMFFNQFLQQQQQQFSSGGATGALRMPRNLSEFQDFQEQEDAANRGGTGPGDSGNDHARKR